MYIQCFITRSDDSDTVVDFEQVRYRFCKNAAGDRVSFVGNEEHRRRLLSMGPGAYRIYDPPEGLQGPIGTSPEPMKKVHIKKRQAEARKAQTQNDVLTDFDWTLEEKIAKTKEFKFLGEDKFKEFVDANVNNVMKWPVDVRRELAKKMVKLFPEQDPDIEGFKLNDYLRS